MVARDSFGEGEKVGVRAFAGANPITRCSQRNERLTFRSTIEYPSRGWNQLVDDGVILNSCLEARSESIGGIEPPTRAQFRCVGIAKCELPLPCNVPRTEELTFAGSTCSGRNSDCRRFWRGLAGQCVGFVLCVCRKGRCKQTDCRKDRKSHKKSLL